MKVIQNLILVVYVFFWLVTSSGINSLDRQYSTDQMPFISDLVMGFVWPVSLPILVMSVDDICHSRWSKACYQGKAEHDVH